jgi:hypothetical protein
MNQLDDRVQRRHTRIAQIVEHLEVFESALVREELCTALDALDKARAVCVVAIAEDKVIPIRPK